MCTSDKSVNCDVECDFLLWVKTATSWVEFSEYFLSAQNPSGLTQWRSLMCATLMLLISGGPHSWKSSWAEEAGSESNSVGSLQCVGRNQLKSKVWEKCLSYVQYDQSGSKVWFQKEDTGVWLLKMWPWEGKGDKGMNVGDGMIMFIIVTTIVNK